MTYQSTVLADTPILYWRLEDASSPFADDTGNGRVGTLSAGGTFQNPSLIPQGGFSFFLGSGSIDAAATSAAAVGTFTIEAWIYWFGLVPGNNVILAYIDDGTTALRRVILRGTANTIRVQDNNGNSVDVALPILDWGIPHHFIVTYDSGGNVVSLFVDGEVGATGSVTLDPLTIPASTVFSVGDGSGGAGNDPALFDEVAFYSTALTSGQAAAHFTAAGPRGYQDGVLLDYPLFFWRLEEAASPFQDASPNNHDGTGSGTLTEQAPGLIAQGDFSIDFATDGAISDGPSGDYAVADFTLEFWVQFGVAQTDPMFILNIDDGGISRAAQLGLSPFELTLADATVNTGSVTIPDFGDTAHHVVLTYNDSGTVMEVFIDGSSAGTASLDLDDFTTSATLFFGDPILGIQNAAVVDEIAFYAFVLGSDRVLNHYLTGTGFAASEIDAALLGVARAATTGGVFLSQPGEQSADIQAQLLDIDDMDNPVLLLDQAVRYQWQDPFSEPGAGVIEMMNDDPDLASVLPQSLVRFDYKGWAAFTMICEQYERTSVAQNEEADETTVWSGRGHLALLERGLVYPSGGADRQPVADDRGFNWSAVEYDDSSWAPSTVMASAASAKVAWAGSAALAIDPVWPDDAALLIWASSGTPLLAPIGTCYFRQTVNITAPGSHIIYWLTDNSGSLYIDGLHLQDSTRFLVLSTALIDLSAGDHVFAARVFNGPAAPINGGPGAFAFVIYTAGFAGEPVDFVAHSDASWKILEYPPVTPGMTPGEVIRICVDEMQARGVLPGLTLSFSDNADTAGNPWPEVADIATKVGTDVLTFFRELAGTYVDIWMEPGALRLSAWNYGTRGQARPVVIESPTDPNDPDSGNLTQLVHKGTG